MTIELIDERVQALQAEQRTVQSDLRRLQAMQQRATDEHVTLLGELGRGRSVDETALDAASGALDLLDAEIGQKRAALAQIERELKEAGIDREEAEQAGVVGRLDRLRSEYVQLVAELDANPLQVDHWRRVKEIAGNGNRTILRLTGDKYGPTPFRSPMEDVAGWFRKWGEEMNRSLTNSRYDAQPKKPSELLQCERLNATIDGLLG